MTRLPLLVALVLVSCASAPRPASTHPAPQPEVVPDAQAIFTRLQAAVRALPDVPEPATCQEAVGQFEKGHDTISSCYDQVLGNDSEDMESLRRLADNFIGCLAPASKIMRSANLALDGRCPGSRTCIQSLARRRAIEEAWLNCFRPPLGSTTMEIPPNAAECRDRNEAGIVAALLEVRAHTACPCKPNAPDAPCVAASVIFYHPFASSVPTR